jgi:hypothetical protein
MDDSAFLWEHVIFGLPPNRNSLTDRYEILQNWLRWRVTRCAKNDNSRFSGGLLPIYLKYTVTAGVCLFLLILREPYSLNGKRHLDHNASIDADFLKETPVRGVEI